MMILMIMGHPPEKGGTKELKVASFSEKERSLEYVLSYSQRPRAMISSYENSEDEDYNPPMGEHYYDQIILSKLPKSIKKLEGSRKELTDKIDALKLTYLQEIEQNKSKKI